MCLKHAEFCRVLTDSNFNGLTSLIVDKSHCIGQWGGDFWPAYSELGKLRVFFPPDIPVLATTATTTQNTLRDIRCTLGIDLQTSFFLNLGNDHPNISLHVHRINSATDYDSLCPYLFRSGVTNVSTRDSLIKGIIFVNAIMPAHLIAHTVKSWLPRHLWKYVDYLHLLRSPQAKQ
jgi:superfamily II DNA helicase RecQ